MTYEEFTDGIRKYKELFDKGLKKQANKQLFDFADKFKKEVLQAEGERGAAADIPNNAWSAPRVSTVRLQPSSGDEILCRFCRELLDEGKYDEFWLCGSPRLPFQLTGLIFEYLNRECAEEKMPQMRWAYQLFGKYYNPHDPQCAVDTYRILAHAYDHPECDQKTVDLYFDAQVNELGFGAHHFPEGCCIAREMYEDCISVCERILSEKQVHEGLAAGYRYYKALYELWYNWNDNGRSGDFTELCKANGLEFAPFKAYYYN